MDGIGGGGGGDDVVDGDLKFQSSCPAAPAPRVSTFI